MYLLDTNHCFRIVARDAALIARLEAHSSARFLTSVIVAGELRYGASISQRRAENVAAVEVFLEGIELRTISPSIAKRYGDLKARLLEAFGPKERAKRRSFELSKLGFRDNDLWIAATAVDTGATIVSTDGDLRRVANVSSLEMENWLE